MRKAQHSSGASGHAACMTETQTAPNVQLDFDLCHSRALCKVVLKEKISRKVDSNDTAFTLPPFCDRFTCAFTEPGHWDTIYYLSFSSILFNQQLLFSVNEGLFCKHRRAGSQSARLCAVLFHEVLDAIRTCSKG